MLIPILFGTHYRENRVGKVANYCSRCLKASTHLVIDRYRVDWVFIPLGSGTFVETVLQCKSCREYRLCEIDAFEKIVPGDEEFSLDDLINETNPGLRKHLSASVELNNREQHFPAAGPQVSIQPIPPVNGISVGSPSLESECAAPNAARPAKLCQLFEQIAPYSTNGEPYDRLYERLKNWDVLSAADQEKLCRKVEKFIARRRIEEFLAEVTQTYPTWNHLINLTVAAIAFVAAGLSGLLLFLLLPNERNPRQLGPMFITAAYSGGAAIGLLIIIIALADSVRKRRWFVRTLIPSAVVREIDLEDILDWLSAAKDFKQHETPKVAAMRKDAWRFRSMVHVHRSTAADRVGRQQK